MKVYRTHKNLVGLALVMGLLISCLVAAPASGEDQPVSMILILDASGSMWGQVGGKAKIEVAKESMAKIIADLPDNARVGLIAYGHRAKGDCNDVEELVPVGPIDKARLTAAVNGLQPKGMTPITTSLEQAVAAIRSEEAQSSVILVSDGKETCEGDPCAVAKALKDSGVKFIINVIGFDVSMEERKQLECVAEAGGGKYFAASAASDFLVAAQEVTRTDKTLPPATGEGKVWLDEPAVVVSGAEFTVHFEAAATFHSNAWIGVVPTDVPHGKESVNDNHETSYEHLLGRTSGAVTLSAPTKPGTYDVRMNDSDYDGREVAHATFTVKPAAGSLSVDKTEYVTGEKIEISFNTPPGLNDKAWAGLIPSDLPHGDESQNDAHDVYYEYLQGRTSGVLTWSAPAKPGKWDVRLHDTDNNGTEIASVSFTVKLASGTLSLDKQTYAPGEEIQVNFTTSVALDSSAWVGMIPASVPHGKESDGDDNDLGYKYMGGETQGAMTFTAPDKPGSYDMRMYDTDASGNELTSAPFTVK